MKFGAYFSKKEDLLSAVFESRDVRPGEVAAVVVGIFDGLTLQAWFEPRLKAKEAAMESAVHLIRGMQKNRRRNSRSGTRK